MPSLNWIGKEAVLNHHREVPYRLLKCEGDLSNGEPGSGNLLVEGDNLEALKALLPYYRGRVKCIYIDPPYNTGNKDWAYNDNVDSPEIKKWLGQVIDNEKLDRHDRWLCMMWPRVSLLKEFLTRDGVLFISLDHNEAHRCREMLESLFPAVLDALPVVTNLKGNQDEFGFAGTHEYLLVALASAESTINQFKVEEIKDDWDADEYGPFKKGANLKATGTNAPRHKRENLFFPIFIKAEDDWFVADDDVCQDQSYDSVFPETNGVELSWRWEKAKLKKEPYNVLISKSKGKWTVFKKQRPAFGDFPTSKPKSVLYKPSYSSTTATNEIKALGLQSLFQNPKPVQLIADVLQFGSTGTSIILDSFAGSGTTGEAMKRLNSEDKGSRNCILVEMMPTTARNVTAARLKKIGLEFRYCTLGETLFDPDGQINENVTPERLGHHIWFTETGEPLPYKVSRVEGAIHFRLGIDPNSGSSIDLLFGPLNRTTLELIQPHEGQRIVYADGLRLDSERLSAENIVYKAVPYDVRDR